MSNPSSTRNASNINSKVDLFSMKNGAFEFFTPILRQLAVYYSKAKSFIYDAVILRMTEKWYRNVLNRLYENSVLLDVGIGTGGALLRCVDIVKSKNIKVVGIDIDSAYVEAGKLSIQSAGLSGIISIDRIDVYEGREALLELAKEKGAALDSDGRFFDAVYFSGSFSLLPDPVKALQLVSELVKNKKVVDGCDVPSKGSIFITQTYQRRTPFFLPYVKPLLKYATTIDFGNLVREEEVLQTFNDSGLKVIEHKVIPGSVDNSLQAAYLTILGE
mmetsp:Transcript_10162/g.21831  ORF Transcript_10162/g.21831 Transcript_10162/m.21831 type:complete len:274 (+) Transcript_10162:250-1071(+)|eukprot:CAMPEP_0171338708 /NCGR_PEP_ID=MMETSP0878-20121228/7493_1 /TAXON_ID=67004 /ORGANISM="Thalassiosira weissflogii, Strain CCMP1336" /LENGTH=273 /DNA_ID=CAMNT_0011840515 /DNA_START=225 /DNA_END=1046 /DNA_ORIENTATION=+